MVRRYAPDGPKPPLPVYAPVGAAERIAAAYSSETEPVDDVYTFFRLQPGTFPIGPFTVTVDRVNHPIETYGVRVEQGGGVLAYSADTAPCESLLRLAAGRGPVPLRGQLPGRRGQPARPAPHRR